MSLLFNETQKKHILFVDDSPVLLRTVKGFVPPKYKVSIAVNAEQAFKIIDMSMPDLIFLDYEMPDINGAQLFKLFKGRPDMDNVPVIFLTAQSSQECIQEIMELQPAGYILKPPSAERINAAIKKQLLV